MPILGRLVEVLHVLGDDRTLQEQFGQLLEFAVEHEALEVAIVLVQVDDLLQGIWLPKFFVEDLLAGKLRHAIADKARDLGTRLGHLIGREEGGQGEEAVAGKGVQGGLRLLARGLCINCVVHLALAWVFS